MKPAALVLLLAALPLLAQTTPVLIPTYYNGPGQFGSQWFTHVRVVNGTNADLDGHGLTFNVQCPIPEGCERPSVPARQYGDLVGPQSDRGLLLHLPIDSAEQFEFDAHFGEGDRRSYELPIVREDDFRQTAFGLPVVPFLGDFRSTLRIYSPDPLADQQVRVRIVPAYAPFALAEAGGIVTLSVDIPTSLPIRPAFAQLNLQRAFPEVTSGAMRVELEPLPRLDGRIPRIWAFVTVTFNDRNDVVVISPQ